MYFYYQDKNESIPKMFNLLLKTNHWLYGICRLTNVLVTNADWYPEAMQCMSEIISIVESVGKRYVDSGDLASAAALYEGTCYALERLLDPMDSSLQRVSRKAENLFSALEDNEKEQVAVLLHLFRLCQWLSLTVNMI